MKQYEKFSSEAKQGLQNFRDAFPKMLEKHHFSIEAFPINYNNLNAVLSLNNVKIFVYMYNLVVSACVLTGASIMEAHEAAKFAKSKKYWFDSCSAYQTKEQSEFWRNFKHKFDN